MCMVRGPLINKPVIAWRVGEQNPSRAATQRFAHCGKFGAPTINAAKVPGKHRIELRADSTTSAQTVEIHFMSDHRIGRDQFLTLDPVQKEERCASDI